MSYLKKIVFVAVILGGLWFSLAYVGRTVWAAGSACQIECKTCAATCEQTLKYCRQQGHANLQHIKALQDCISTCKQSADFMKRNSSLQNLACGLCEKACISCAESCATFKGDKIMQACANECHKCAQSCHKMSE